MKEHEESLIKSAQRGNGEAFGELYDEYMPRIYRFVLVKVSRRQDAEDLTHHVFISAWENIVKYRFQGVPFSSWLYRIANNAVIDFYRTSKNHQPLESISETIVSELPPLESNVDRNLELHAIKASLAKLDPDQQNVLIMKFIDDLSNKEIAQALEKTEGAVRVIQHRALKQLKHHIDATQPHRTTEEA